MIIQSSTEAKGKPLPAAANLLQWYDRHARVLPWRSVGGEMPDPYRVWISEIMLQQTTVQAVKAYFIAFTSRWPTVQALAAAPVEEVMKMWAGLGYYSRARNLHACARTVVEKHGGVFPRDEATLQTLPGIGVYTSAAISAIAYNQRAVVVDGNVERVIARLFQVEEALPAAKPVIRAHTDALTPDQRPGDFAQAMMDLGATVCTPRKPSCAICPYLGSCEAQRNSDPEIYPRKIAKSEKPLRRGAAFLVWRADGALLVRTRPPKGLLGGMTEVPGTDWLAAAPVWLNPQGAPFAADWQRSSRVVRHVFTHFPLELSVFRTMVTMHTKAPAEMRWLAGSEIASDAFPTVFRKVLAAEFD
ncbi:MAG: A/G-specific adenine glycosylase [Beijerinckiaceae bacterium]